ncbi:MAG: DNA-directed RNA polymerase subunit alpha [Candidatus Muiribacteriota bacterium]
MNFFSNVTFLKDKNRKTTEYGRFIFESFNPGTGRIFGNAIRRMLYITVPGAAIVKLKFDAALHEFSYIPEVVEDVQEIIMNLRKVVFSLQEDHIIIRVEKDKPGKLLAGDIPEINTLKVINKEQYIATINPGGILAFEIELLRGEGYGNEEENQYFKENIGDIILDTNFSPIKKVGYFTEKYTTKNNEVRERLIMDVDCNGSIEVERAMVHAITNLSEYTQIFTNFTEYIEEVKQETEEIAGIDKASLPIGELNLSVRSKNCLKYVSAKTVGDLTKYSPQELMEIKNFGKKSLVEIRQKLAELGLALKGEGIVDENFDAMSNDEDDDTEE